jgi:hypothetical protein
MAAAISRSGKSSQNRSTMASRRRAGSPASAAITSRWSSRKMAACSEEPSSTPAGVRIRTTRRWRCRFLVRLTTMARR